MRVEVVTLSPGQYDDLAYAGSPPCREPSSSTAYTPVQHAWQLMQGPPDPIWWCSRCQRIEQRVLTHPA